MIPFPFTLGQAGMAQASGLAGGGSGATPVILGSATCNQGSDTTSHPITMPGSIAAGDYLLICFVKDGGAAADTLAGWTTLASIASGSSENHTMVYARVATGGDTATVTTAGAETSAAVALRIKPALASYAATFSQAASTSPDCPNLAPGIGLANFLWLAVFGTSADASVTAGPSGYAAVATDAGGAGAAGSRVAVYSKAAASSSENPGTATSGGTTRTWGLATVGVRD